MAKENNSGRTLMEALQAIVFDQALCSMFRRKAKINFRD